MPLGESVPAPRFLFKSASLRNREIHRVIDISTTLAKVLSQTNRVNCIKWPETPLFVQYWTY
jgi:hypothetical protein